MPKLYEVIDDGGIKKPVPLSGSGGASLIIDDTIISTDKVWSSSKVNTELTKKAEFPPIPSENGTYVLQISIDNEVIAYSWQQVINVEEVEY